MGSNVVQRVWATHGPILPLLRGSIRNSFQIEPLSQQLSSMGTARFSLNNLTRLAAQARFCHSDSLRNVIQITRSVTSPHIRNQSSSVIITSVRYGFFQRSLGTPTTRSHIRSFNTGHGGRRTWRSRRNKSSLAKDGETKSSTGAKAEKNSTTPESSAASKGKSSVLPNSKNIMDRLPHLPHMNMHRPTKEELLAAATGFWSRLKVRFKWFSIRSARPFNADEIGALISWLFLGHVIWILLGTTTFVSLAILAVNTVSAQETLARSVGNYLTKSSGITVVFESAIVPKWRDGVITFKNVFVSRRPGQSTSTVSKGSRESAALAAAATAGNNNEEDTNYTQFDVTIDTVNVTLSFAKWFNSKGLLADVEVKGVRGVIDRTHVHSTGEDIDPKSYRHEHNPGDFELDSFKLEDLLLTVHQPGGFRPFSVSIFSCDLPQLRRQWMFYDFLCANNVSGAFDESLFTIHPRQMHGHVGSEVYRTAEKGAANPWKKHSRMRIDGLNIDHLNRGVEGPFSWITEGNVDIIADVLLPSEGDESIAKVMTDFYDQLELAVTSRLRIPRDDVIDTTVHRTELTMPAISQPNPDRKFIVMDLRINFNDIKAAVPIFTRDLSYVSSALIRPIVAYLNSRKTFIPITCRIVKRVSDFNGSWTLYDCGMLEDFSAEVYTSIVKDISDHEARVRRFKKVGLWSLQLAVQALFMGMAGNLA
jgi:mitochondrial distribution and morphology protein 31